MSLNRRDALVLRRRLLVAEAALQRARLRHEVQLIGAAAAPSAWAAQATRHWPWLSLATTVLLKRRSAPALALSAVVLAWRWWRRTRRRR